MSDTPPLPDDLRPALLEQLAYLRDEAEAMKAAARRLPDVLLEGRPLPEDASVKELLAALALADARIFRPLVEAMMAEDDASATLPPPRALTEDGPASDHESWSDVPLDALLDRLRSERERLIETLRAVPPTDWRRTGTLDGAERDLYALGHFITQHDAETLRTISYRLHESHIVRPPTGDEPDASAP